MSISDSNNDKKMTGLTQTHPVALDTINEKDADIALAYAAKLDDGTFVLTPELDRKVLRKIDFILLPIISFTTFLSFLDKVSNNYAQNYGLSTDIGLTGTQYSWSASVFYFGFLVMQFPNNYLLQKLPLGKVISVCAISWGLIILGQGFVKTASPFMALRFIQGLFEAPVLPAVLLMTSMYWKRSEQSFRAAFWFNSVAGILGGLFAYGIGHINGSLQSWRYLMIIYGSVTTAWGIVLFFILPDSPLNAIFLSEEEKLAVVARVKDNQTGITNKVWKWEQFWECIFDVKTWVFCIFALAANIPNGGLNAFSTSVIKGFGFSSFNTALLSIPFGFIGTSVNLVIGACISFTSNKRMFWVAFITCVPFVGTIIQYSLAQSTGHTTAKLVGYYMTGCFNTPYVMMQAMVSSNTAGHTKKLVTGGLLWMFYCAGNIAGPFFFKTNQAPKYQLGSGAMMCCFAIMLVLSLFLAWYLRFINNRREAFREHEEEESAEHAFLDLTDKKNSNFVYTM